MQRHHALPLLALALAACGPTVPNTPHRRLPPVVRPQPHPEPSAGQSSAAPASSREDASSGGASEPRSSATPTAADRVRALLEDVPVVPADEASWFPQRVLEVVARASGELPAPTAPVFEGDRVVWSLVSDASASTDAAAHQAVCTAVTQAEPRIACAVDTVAVGATDRARVAFGWRRGEGAGVRADVALPLRALGRLRTGACLVSAERTLHTVEMRVQTPDLRALGTTLALLAAAPHLSDVILVESERAASGGMNARLSWPTDRAERDAGEFGADAWPARCGEHDTVGGDAPARSPAQPLVLLRGERVRGAVLHLARREWLVTDGDQVGDALVTSVTDRGVYLRRARAPRPALVAFARRPAAGATTASSRGADGLTPRLPPVRIPPPPEPPAVPSAP